jgi:iron-sulfur cluster assembly protein
MLLTFTDAAIHHIQKLLKNKGDHVALRLAVKKTGCSGYMYVPEIVTEKKETDAVVEAPGFCVYVDKDAVAIIQGTELDYVKKNLGFEQLVFHNPNAEGLCGCGESFKLKEQG